MTGNQDLSQAHWRKARMSIGQGGCVEVADLGAMIALRDSKNPDGPALVFTPAEWDSFLNGARNGEFAQR